MIEIKIPAGLLPNLFSDTVHGLKRVLLHENSSSKAFGISFADRPKAKTPERKKGKRKRCF
jgi:hypothetical protein